MTIAWVDIEVNTLSTFGAGGCKQRCLVEQRVSSADHLWMFYIDNANNLEWRKSTDGGATWGSLNTIDSTQTWTDLAIWYDRWTPDDTTGNTVHILATNTDLDLATYFTLGLDDDTAEAVNDVDIVASPGALLAARSSPTICKATDGDIYVAWNVSATAVGFHIYRSGDSGATWGSIYGRTEWDVDADTATDVPHLMPLKTDDDIICIWIDDTANDILSIRYDGTSTDATGWDANVVTVDDDAIASGNPYLYQYLSTVVDDTGDIYCGWLDGATVNLTTEIYMKKYDESASSWGAQRTIYEHIMTSGTNQDEMYGINLCYDKIDDALFCCLNLGEGGTDTRIFLTQSYDNGVTWGTTTSLILTVDDYRAAWMPEAILHTDNKLCVAVNNVDQSDIESLNGGITLLRKTGNVVDDTGTAVTTADCNFFRVQTESHQEALTAYIFLGKATSDGSGNWSVPLVDPHNDTPEFQVLYDDDLANDETDASRRFSS